MKNMIRRAACFLLTAALALGLMAVPSRSASDLYFTAINDNLAPLTADTMPFWSGGVIYVPYTVFDRSYNSGVYLGVYCSYDRSDNRVTLYNIGPMLVFDLNTGACWDDNTGEAYSARAIMRNGRPYLPLSTVCDYFGLEYSYTSIPTVSQGYLVRIKSSAVVLSDAKFLDAAKDLIARRLREYNQSLVPATTDTQDPVSAPQPSVQEPSKPSQDEPSSDVTTFLAFRCEQADELSSILDTLDSLNAPALFFFTPQLLEEQDDLVRRILGGGHAVGILAEGSSLSETRELLSEGNRLLSALTYTRTTLVYAPKEQRSALSEDGWVCWSETLHLSPASNVSSANFAYQTTNRLSGRTKNTYLTLDCDANAARVLSNLLRQLSAKHFIVSVPLETKL